MTKNLTSSIPSCWLIGTWKSDKVRTLEEWPNSSGSGKMIKPALEAMFGKLVVKYTKKQYQTEFEGDIVRGKYKVVWENSDSIFLVFRVGPSEKGQLIMFDGPDAYWVHAGRGIEFFSRQENA